MPPPQIEELRFLALGDSYTIGERVDPAESWPIQLAQRLQEKGLQLAAIDIIARTGWTTGDLAGAIDVAAPIGPYRLVTLLIGVNNQFRGLDIDAYRAEFASLLQRAVGLAGDRPSHVIVISIPDWGITPFASRFDVDQISAEIDLFNAVNKAETAEVGAIYIDVTGISRWAEADANLLAGDGLHPSGVMYGFWVDLILPEAMTILANP